jgi:hypothetical protein
MEQWEVEMRQAEADGDALLVMETALIEIDRLRQQLAAAPDLLALAEAVEWVDIANRGLACPWCGGKYPQHQPSCPHPRALAKARGQGEEE